MPAPRHKPLARLDAPLAARSPRLAHALALLLASACASNPPELAGPATPSVTQELAPVDRYAPPPPATSPAGSPAEELDNFKQSLAAYEAQLAQNEARLQAMGVRIARAEPAAEKRDADDNRFAPPPPAPAQRPGDAPSAGATTRQAKDKTSERVLAKKSREAPRPNAPRSDSAGLGRAQGSAGEAAKAPARDEADGDHTRCADLCDLAHATCDLEAKICDLATRHVDEPRYAEVCQRAGDDCRAAADACTLCSP